MGTTDFLQTVLGPGLRCGFYLSYLQEAWQLYNLFYMINWIRIHWKNVTLLALTYFLICLLMCCLDLLNQYWQLLLQQKYQRLGDLKIINFLQFWSLGNLKSRHRQIQWLERACFLDHSQFSSPSDLHVFIKALNLSGRFHPHNIIQTSLFLKGPTSRYHLTHWGLGFNIQIEGLRRREPTFCL